MSLRSVFCHQDTALLRTERYSSGQVRAVREGVWDQSEPSVLAAGCVQMPPACLSWGPGPSGSSPLVSRRPPASAPSTWRSVRTRPFCPDRCRALAADCQGQGWAGCLWNDPGGRWPLGTRCPGEKVCLAVKAEVTVTQPGCSGRSHRCPPETLTADLPVSWFCGPGSGTSWGTD